MPVFIKNNSHIPRGISVSPHSQACHALNDTYTRPAASACASTNKSGGRALLLLSQIPNNPCNRALPRRWYWLACLGCVSAFHAAPDLLALTLTRSGYVSVAVACNILCIQSLPRSVCFRWSPKLHDSLTNPTTNEDFMHCAPSTSFAGYGVLLATSSL